MLEIGGGAGANFPFITEPVNLTVSEPSKLFVPYYDDNIKPFKEKLNLGDLVEVSWKKALILFICRLYLLGQS